MNSLQADIVDYFFLGYMIVVKSAIVDKQPAMQHLSQQVSRARSAGGERGAAEVFRFSPHMRPLYISFGDRRLPLLQCSTMLACWHGAFCMLHEDQSLPVA